MRQIWNLARPDNNRMKMKDNANMEKHRVLAKGDGTWDLR